MGLTVGLTGYGGTRWEGKRCEYVCGGTNMKEAESVGGTWWEVEPGWGERGNTSFMDTKGGGRGHTTRGNSGALWCLGAESLSGVVVTDGRGERVQEHDVPSLMSACERMREVTHVWV